VSRGSELSKKGQKGDESRDHHSTSRITFERRGKESLADYDRLEFQQDASYLGDMKMLSQKDYSPPRASPPFNHPATPR
jgi:hypothetical protein